MLWVYENGCELEDHIYEEVLRRYPEAKSALWTEKHDFLVDMDSDKLVDGNEFGFNYIENTQIAILQNLERERLDEEDKYFSRLGAGSLG